MTVLWLWISIWLTAAGAAPLTADDAVSLVLERSPEVARASAELDAVRAQASASARPLMDPVVEAHWAVSGDASGVSVTQPLSVTGEGLAVRRSWSASADQAQATQSRARLEVAASARRAWVRAVEAREVVALAGQALELATRLREGAEERLASGDGSLLDARLARLHEAGARSTWMVAVDEEGSQLTRLSAWTGVPVGAIELPGDPLEGMPLTGLTTGSRSDVEAARHRVAAAHAALRRERAGSLPPVELGAFYEEEGGEVRAGPSVAISIPLWQRNADGRAQAGAELAIAESAAAERERTAEAEQQAATRVVRQLEAAPAGSDPRAEAQAAWESVSMGYERGELDLLTAGLLRVQILEGQRAWLEGRRVLAEARISAALAHEDAALLAP